MTTTTTTTTHHTMAPAPAPRLDPDGDRLVVAAGDGRVTLGAFRDIVHLLRRGDLLVVNDAGTRPSSLQLTTAGGARVELRLLDDAGDAGERVERGERDDRDGAAPAPRATFGAVVFGEGDWRLDTDRRPAPPRLAAGDVLRGEAGAATVTSVSPLSPRLVRVRFDDALGGALFRIAAPVQYSYMAAALRLGDVQTPYASRPWAAEMPSAGRALRTSLLVALRRRGVRIARLTAAAGLSATGDPALDRLLPLPERYEIPEDTAAAVAAARASGGRIIAVGTSTVRALESAVDEHGGAVVAGAGIASLIIGPAFVPRVVDGIVSGMHEAGTSHDALLRAFAPSAVVDRVIDVGRGAGLMIHELGDHCLIMRGRA